MTVAANALISLVEFKAWMGIDAADTSKDTLNESAISAASQQIEKLTGIKWITPGSAITEIFSGDNAEFAYLKNRPIGSITSLWYWDGSAWNDIYSEWDNTFDAATGKVYFTAGATFFKGHMNWKAVYSYGYTIANIPADLKMVCAMVAARIKKLFEDGLHGISTKSFGDQSTSFDFSQLPPFVKDTLAKYKRV